MSLIGDLNKTLYSESAIYERGKNLGGKPIVLDRSDAVVMPRSDGGKRYRDSVHVNKYKQDVAQGRLEARKAWAAGGEVRAQKKADALAKKASLEQGRAKSHKSLTDSAWLRGLVHKRDWDQEISKEKQASVSNKRKFADALKERHLRSRQERKPYSSGGDPRGVLSRVGNKLIKKKTSEPSVISRFMQGLKSASGKAVDAVDKFDKWRQGVGPRLDQRVKDSRREFDAKKAKADARRAADKEAAERNAVARAKAKQDAAELAKEVKDSAEIERHCQRSQKKAERGAQKALASQRKNRHYANVKLFENTADEGLRTAFNAFTQGVNAPGGGIGRGVGMAAKTLVNQKARNIARRNQAGIEQSQAAVKQGQTANALSAKNTLSGTRAYNKLGMDQVKHNAKMASLTTNTGVAAQRADMKSELQGAKDDLLRTKNSKKWDIVQAKRQAADAAHQQKVQGIADGTIKTGVMGVLDKFDRARNWLHDRSMASGQRKLERGQLNYDRAMYKQQTKMADPNYRLKVMKKASQIQGGGNRGIIGSFMQGFEGQS
jgi:hypothetical protein